MVCPISISDLVDANNKFSELHKNCKPGWSQLMPDPMLSKEQKIEFWIEYGERGISSMTIVEILTNRSIWPDLRYYPPSEPDDFRRCYLLFEMVPELKKDIPLLLKISPVWANLVDNWDTLTGLLEDQLKNKKSNGMYELMKKLGC